MIPKIIEESIISMVRVQLVETQRDNGLGGK